MMWRWWMLAAVMWSFALIREGRTVWDNVSLCENSEYRYEMTDVFFCFCHIAHMAKHFENCGLLRFEKSAQSLCKMWFAHGVRNAEFNTADLAVSGAGRVFPDETVKKLLTNVRKRRLI